MPRRSHSLLLVLAVSCLLSTRAAEAQSDRIEIAAGTEEDHALQAITAEQDPQKKVAMFQEFVQKFSANPSAVTYGNWQISQAYQAAGDLPKALDYGDKALVASPHNLDILVSQASLAQQAKDNSRLIAYAVKGGEACQSIGKQAKPAATSDEDFAKQIAEEKDAAKNNCEFLETSGFNVIASETDPKLRMADIEAFTAAFPDSKYQDQVSNYAMYTLGPGQLNDAARLVAFGEKTLAANPKSLPALLLLASVYVEEPKPASVAKAISYSQRAIEAAKPDASDADKPRKLSAGVAHSTIGYAYMKQEKTAAAIPELKAAVALLKGQDDIPYSVALYRLGYAYAKLVRNTEAREVLMEAVKIQGPVQAVSQELLNKVNVARAKGK
jgi:tetratricopeptide (TPR) repeat protein